MSTPSTPRWIYPEWKRPLEAKTKELCESICKKFNYPSVHQWQALAMQALLNGTDVVASSGTGWGKSLVFQGMTLAKSEGIVLVISPLISIMDNQVEKMKKIGISAVALTRHTKEKNKKVWDEVAKGRYQIVYASPEVILNKRGHFLVSLVRNPNKFMQNLVAVAVDEAHLIWDWIGFRDKYQLLGVLRNILSQVPWVLLSATLSPMVAAYAHEVCNLQTPSMRLILSCARDNIDMVVRPINTTRDLSPLLDLIDLRAIKDIKHLPRTIIFYDSIDGAQRIADALRVLVPHDLPTDGRTLIQMFFGSIDDPKKTQTLLDLESGLCRIIICTDAFGLGVDISKIARVIQWGIDEKVTISALTQRMGRAARRDPKRREGEEDIIGQFIIFVQKAILEAVPKDWEAGWENKPAPAPAEWEDVHSDDDDDSPRVIPVSKGRRLDRFGLPVTTETKTKVSLFVRNIYQEVKSLKEASRQAKAENKGTQKQRLKAAQKIDPAVLWVVCTVGCRRKATLSVYKDEMDFLSHHRSWCCDPCAKRMMDEPSDLTDLTDTRDPQLKVDINLLKSSVAFAGTDVIFNRTTLSTIDHRHNQQSIGGGPMVCPARRTLLKQDITRYRDSVFKLLGLPRFITTEMLLPTAVIGHLGKTIRKITSPMSLRQELRAAKFDLGSSFWPGPESICLRTLYEFIVRALEATAYLEPAHRLNARNPQRQQISPRRLPTSPRHIVSPQRLQHKRMLSSHTPFVSPTKKRVRQASGQSMTRNLTSAQRQ